jgi:predicted nucleic acid-binding protein
VANELLLDTGALVSLLDRRQRQHTDFLDFFESWKDPILSTEAVLTEAMHLLASVPGGQATCLEFFLAEAALVIPSTLHTLRRCRDLIAKYHDLPMDFADASLVVLAEDIGTDLIFTTDRRDFGIYRIAGKAPFRILP